MANTLWLGLALLSLAFMTLFALYQWQTSRGDRVVPALWHWSLLPLLIIGLSLGTYSYTGRYNDWQLAEADDSIDYLLAAEIVRLRRASAEAPQDTSLMQQLAQAYVRGGMYLDAVATLKQQLQLQGKSAALLGQLAEAAYYRDQRQWLPESQEWVEQALALDSADPGTRLLLANDAFLNQRYAEAIGHWQLLLDSDNEQLDRQALQYAIANARSRLE